MKIWKEQYKKNPDIFFFTRTLIVSQNIPQYGYLKEIALIHDYVRDEIRFTRDVLAVETLQTPDITLKIKTGDCDDKSLLFASMVESIGHPTKFVTCGHTKNNQKHVYSIVRIGSTWYTSETCLPYPFGKKHGSFPVEIVW